ncbi:MAG: DUF1330 domain-containing protein [Xanthobacteraceae bacterium]
MAAYVHINLKVLDAEKQAAFAPRFQSAISAAGGRILWFGPVVEQLEGEVAPLPLAGVFEFPTVEQALAFYRSDAYAPLKQERQTIQEARMFIVDSGPVSAR